MKLFKWIIIANILSSSPPASPHGDTETLLPLPTTTLSRKIVPLTYESEIRPLLGIIDEEFAGDHYGTDLHRQRRQELLIERLKGSVQEIHTSSLDLELLGRLPFLFLPLSFEPLFDFITPTFWEDRKQEPFTLIFRRACDEETASQEIPQDVKDIMLSGLVNAGYLDTLVNGAYRGDEHCKEKFFQSMFVGYFFRDAYLARISSKLRINGQPVLVADDFIHHLAAHTPTAPSCVSPQSRRKVFPDVS